MLLRFWTFFALLAGGAACLPAAVLYSVTDIGVLSGNHTVGTGINNAGQITGYSYIYNSARDSTYHAILYSNGVLTDLGALGGNFSEAYAINDAGQITGRTAGASGAGSYAFLYSNGVMTYLSTPLGENYSEGFGINNAGQITGYYLTASGFVHVFLYSNGAMNDIGSGYGYAINNAGQITGTSGHAFLYSNGVMTDIGTLPGAPLSPGGPSSIGYAINNAGQITGYAVIGSYGGGVGLYHAFLYSNGVMTDLGTLLGGGYSEGYGINDAGQITGSYGQGAFLYSNGVMTDLNSIIDPNLRITLTNATGINDFGQIVADGYYGSDSLFGANRAYLLTPVPEPGTWALFGAGLLLVAVRARSYTK